MGIPLDGAAGPLDAITDVPGVAVGHTTLIAALGIGRMGGIAGAGSGDLFLAFSTAKTGISDSPGVASVRMLDDERIDPVYEATVQATEEAIINALLAARTMDRRQSSSRARPAPRSATSSSPEIRPAPELIRCLESDLRPSCRRRQDETSARSGDTEST
jgi:L-aminopeptidase/D-esterase-like protein